MDAIINDSFFSFVLIGIGMALIFLEVFIPSGGIIGVIAIFLMGLGVFGFFHQDNPLAGLVSAAGSLVFVISMRRSTLRAATKAVALQNRVHKPAPTPVCGSARCSVFTWWL